VLNLTAMPVGVAAKPPDGVFEKPAGVFMAKFTIFYIFL